MDTTVSYTVTDQTEKSQTQRKKYLGKYADNVKIQLVIEDEGEIDEIGWANISFNIKCPEDKTGNMKCFMQSTSMSHEWAKHGVGVVYPLKPPFRCKFCDTDLTEHI